MLPLFNLQPTNLANFDTGLNTAELLPQEAIEPSAGFAELLRLGVQTASRQVAVVGTQLPRAGNPLPVPDLPEVEAVAADLQREAPLATMPVLNGELLQIAPLVPAAGDGKLREALGTAPPGLAASQTGLETRLTQLHSQSAAEADGINVASRPPGKGAELTTPDGLPQLRPAISRALRDTVAAPTAAPLASPTASELQDEVLPALRRPAVTAPRTTTPIRTAANRATAAEGGSPIPALMRDELPADRRALPRHTGTVQPAPAVSSPAGTVDLPAPTLAQPAQSGSFQLTQLQAPTPGASATPSPSLPTALTIELPVRDAAWGDAVGERVMMMASNRLQSAEIRLTPAELGPLRVQVSVDDGLANVTFHAQHAITREAIEQALPRLRDLLADSGLTLNQANVGQDSEQGLMHGNRDRDDQGDASAGGRAASSAEQPAQEGPDSSRPASRPDSLVDTFV